jgi:hypothetical protein
MIQSFFRKEAAALLFIKAQNEIQQVLAAQQVPLQSKRKTSVNHLISHYSQAPKPTSIYERN